VIEPSGSAFGANQFEQERGLRRQSFFRMRFIKLSLSEGGFSPSDDDGPLLFCDQLRAAQELRGLGICVLLM
jgi:hypothetical protein